jgi:hypothetical protein
MSPFLLWYLIGISAVLVEYFAIPSVQRRMNANPIPSLFGASLGGLLGPIRVALMLWWFFPREPWPDEDDE